MLKTYYFYIRLDCGELDYKTASGVVNAFSYADAAQLVQEYHQYSYGSIISMYIQEMEKPVKEYAAYKIGC